MQTTRREIIHYLKKQGQASVKQLAEATGLTQMTMRHHLAVLESEGLVTSQRERCGVGRPRHVYRLTDKAHDLFPQRYHELAGRLLEGLKESGAEGQISRVLKAMASEMTDDYLDDVREKSFEERLDLLVEVLEQTGFLASWEREEEKYVLTEYSCPYFLIGQDHPEICQVDWQIITTILERPVERQTCVLHGHDVCTFHVPDRGEIRLLDVRRPPDPEPG